MTEIFIYENDEQIFELAKDTSIFQTKLMD